MGKDYTDFFDNLPEEELLEYFPEKLPAMEDRIAAKRIEKNVLRGVQVEEKCRWNGKRIAAAVCCFLISAAALLRLAWGLAYYQSIGPLLTYNALFVPIFFMAGLLCLVMSALFRQAAELKEDQDLTI